MTALTRGPLPARVYWRRRMLLALVVLSLVAGTARLLGLGSDDPPEQRPQARQVVAEPTSGTDEPSVAVSDTPSETRARQQPPREDTRTKQDRRPVLAEPEGVCSERDVAVTPTVRRPVAGSPVTFTLELRTITAPACTWQVSPSTLTMKVTSGSDDIWTSQECPRAIPSEDVVVRNNVGTEVEVTWSARRSDGDCSPTMTDWALPGWYYVDVAALAGEPSDLQFQLERPEPGVVTETVRRPKSEQRQRGDAEQQRDRPRDRRGGDEERRQRD